jgi:UDP-glucose 4-epimerase
LNILVTGASGFIGSNLIIDLLKSDEYVVYALSRKPIFNSSEKFHNIIGDLSTDDFTKDLPAQMDVVIHLAQSNEYRNFPDKADDIFAINVRSTQMLLEWSRKVRIKKFIFASSGNVYKLQNKLLSENDICAPEGYYGATKYAGEQIITPYKEFYQIVILRIFGAYGHGQDNMTIPNIIKKIKNKEEISLAKAAGLYFTPLFIADCVEMINAVINSNSKSLVYNLAGNDVIHLGHLVEIISKIIAIKPRINLIDKEPMYLMGDSTRFKKDFNYYPSTNIEAGIEKTIGYEKRS